jgi:hypothetical protein
MPPSSAAAGLALVGDEKNFVSASVQNNVVSVRKVENEKETILLEKEVRSRGKLHLRASVVQGKDIVFSFSIDGKKFTQLNNSVVDGFFLPPWDRAVRIAVISKGKPTQKAVFDSFTLKNK